MFNSILADSSGALESIQQLFTQLAGDFNPATVVSILGVAIAACVGLFLFWFGGRKIVRMVSTALRKGKLSI